MCVIALALAGTQLSYLDARACFENNNDGAGYSFVDDKGELHVRKGLMTFDLFWGSYSAAWERFGKNSPFLIHFRIATKGAVGHYNSHPFEVKTGKCAVAHNGVLWGGARTDLKSDTHEFCDELRDELSDENLMNLAKPRLTNMLLGNKLAILYNTKNYVLLNEYAGDWNKDKTIWFSNTHWHYKRTRLMEAQAAADKAALENKSDDDTLAVDSTTTYGDGYPHYHRHTDFMR